jgi:hypothetical protein
VKVVRESEMAGNYTDSFKLEAEAWYAEALKALDDNPGEWVEVDRTNHINRDRVHKLKFDLLNKGSWPDTYETEFRYPESGVCVMYARKHPAKKAHSTPKRKGWFRK